MTCFITNGPICFGKIFFENGSLRFLELSHTFCPRVKGLKVDVMCFRILSAASFPADIASFWWWSIVQSRSSDNSIFVVSIMLGIPGGVYPMIRSYGVHLRSVCNFAL
jgi:hypothetical protein